MSGRKGQPSQKYLTEELNNNKDRIIGGLQYFHSQEMKLSAARESNISKECGSRSSWSTGKKTDITATFLMNKLQLMTVSYFLILLPCIDIFHSMLIKLNSYSSSCFSSFKWFLRHMM